MPNKDGLADPQRSLAEREKIEYPPLEWWPLRVMNPSHKLGFLVALVVANLVVVRLLGAVLPDRFTLMITGPLWLAAVIILARSFRGIGEPVRPPRAWWKLTSRPRAGFLLGTMYLLSSITLLAPTLQSPSGWAAGANALLLGVAFLNSSIRLTILRRRPQ
ncbi:hypothetical protein ACFRFH_05570 [Leifsonia sp. NPDC056824]|uniref:hypothetical protein n=1 Tax=Leifsonia sp. NPDC056824 TaxID=3345953 RepID=UPI0036D0A5DD